MHGFGWDFDGVAGAEFEGFGSGSFPTSDPKKSASDDGEMGKSMGMLNIFFSSFEKTAFAINAVTKNVFDFHYFTSEN